MPAYLLNVQKAHHDLGIRTELAPRMIDGRMHVMPIECTYPNGTKGPMVAGTISRIHGIPKQTYGLRFVQSPIGDTRVDGTTFGIHGAGSHYKSKDIGMGTLLVGLTQLHYDYNRGMRGAQLAARERALTSFFFTMPCNEDGSRNDDNSYHAFGKSHAKMLKHNMETWDQPPPGKSQPEYSCKEYAPAFRWMQVIRIAGKENDFFNVGACCVTNVPYNYTGCSLRPLSSGIGAPAANMAVLAQAANQVFQNMRTPPPAIVSHLLGSPAPVRGHSAPVLVGGPGSGELARPAPLRPDEAANILGGLHLGGSAALPSQADIVENDRVAREALANPPLNEHGSMLETVSEEPEEAEEGEIDEYGNELLAPTNEQLVSELVASDDEAWPAPVARESDKAKGKAPARPRSPDAEDRTGMVARPPVKKTRK